MVSQKKIATNNAWTEKNYDRVSIYLPKGSKELIKEAGLTINGFIMEAVKPELEKLKEAKGK